MPTHQPQLTGIATESVDCGVRATSMAIDKATRGAKAPPVKVLRARMGKTGVVPTNVADWERAITSYDTAAELGGEFERLTGTPLVAGESARVANHLRKGHGAIVAVDYGRYRQLMPHKAGSTSFSGYHAILFTGLANGRTKSWDSLLDGRYRGCPNGPVLVPWDKVREAAQLVGKQEAGTPSVFAYLVNPATSLGGGVVPDPPDAQPTLASVIAELYELLEAGHPVAGVIDDLEAIVGPYIGEAAPDDDAAPGVSP